MTGPGLGPEALERAIDPRREVRFGLRRPGGGQLEPRGGDPPLGLDRSHDPCLGDAASIGVEQRRHGSTSLWCRDEADIAHGEHLAPPVEMGGHLDLLAVRSELEGHPELLI
ncbi:MAG TPA: hypothetical protein VK507_05255, partial [Iamia sp.]|nr:hypothetical protein [Iamia sp.]